MLATKQLMVAIDFYSIFSVLGKSTSNVNCLATNILQIMQIMAELSFLVELYISLTSFMLFIVLYNAH